MTSKSNHSSVDAEKDRPIIYCWFVSDNGAGGSGYAIFDTCAGRPLLPDERLFSTLQETRQAIHDEQGMTPVVIPLHPEWVPKNWKVRNLNAEEVEQLGP